LAQHDAVARLREGRVPMLRRSARQLKGHGLTEGISTRLLVYAALLIRQTLDHTIDAVYV
jgi:nitric oxide reductase NorQ protein